MARQDIFAGELPMDTSFWVSNGHVVRSIKTLPCAIRAMDKDTFKYHVNKERNDFANWVRDIIGDERLANQLLKTKSQRAALQLVQKRVSKIKD